MHDNGAETYRVLDIPSNAKNLVKFRCSELFWQNLAIYQIEAKSVYGDTE